MGLEKKEYEQLSFLDEDIGQGLTLDEYTGILQSEKDGFVTIATKRSWVEDDWRESHHFVKSWSRHIVIEDNVDCYATVNSTYRPGRSLENLRHITAIYSDLDIYNKGLSKEKAIKMINNKVENDRVPKPTFIIDSGRGLYVLWLIESAPGKFKNVQNLYNRVQRFIYENFKEIGADPKAIDLMRVLRVPGSINTKNNEMVKVLKYSEENKYTLRFMQDFMNEVNGVNWEEIKKENKEKKVVKRNKRTAKISRLFNGYTLAVSRARDLENLCVLRDKDIYGNLNSLLHVYCYQMMCIHRNLNVARYQTKELNDSLTHSLSDKQINDISQSVYKAYKRYEKDKKQGYNYRNRTLIEMLKITEDEQKHMKTIISTSEKYRRNNARRRDNRRDSKGLTDKQREVLKRREEVKKLKKEGLSTREIASKLNIHYSTVSRDIATF